MKTSQYHFVKALLIVLLGLFISNSSIAQTDSLQIVNQSSKKIQEPEKKEKKDRKRKDEFKVFAGVSLNQLSVESDTYESQLSPGFLLGASYKRGRFFYWEIGARYNNAVFNLTPIDSSSYSDGLFSIRNFDVPLTVGINILSITSRIVGLRVFVSAVPTFAIGIGDNDIGITKDNLNSFNLYGQGGVGVDIAFLYIETGLNYGFSDLFTNEIKSNPYQVFLNLGFRF